MDMFVLSKLIFINIKPITDSTIERFMAKSCRTSNSLEAYQPIATKLSLLREAKRIYTKRTGECFIRKAFGGEYFKNLMN